MLEHDTIENSQGYVEMKEVDPESVKRAVDFIYTGNTSVATDCISGLLHVAHLMQLNTLCDGIGMLLAKNLNINSFYGTKRFSDVYNCTEAKTCKKFASENFEDVIGFDEFTELDEEFVIHVLKSTPVPEIVKYKAFKKWLDFDPPNRRNSFPKMLRLLDTLQLPAKFRKYIVRNEPMIYESTECLQIMLLAFFKNVHSQDIDIFTQNAIACYETKTSSVLSYDVESESWNLVCKIAPNTIQYFSIVTLDRCIYALTRNRRVLCLQYLTAGAKWTEMAPMLQDHGRHPSVVVHDRFVYAVGNTDSASKSFEKYDPTTNKWTVISVEGDFLVQWESAICSALDSVFVLGGKVQQRTVSSNRLDLGDFSWEAIAPMLCARRSPATAHHNGRIYVAGGRRDHDVIANSSEVYDIPSNTWTSISNIPMNTLPLRAVVVMDRLFVISKSNIVEYDTENDSWLEIYKRGQIDPSYGCAPITT